MVQHVCFRDAVSAGIRRCRPEHPARTGEHEYRYGALAFLSVERRGNAAITDSIRVLQRSEPHQLWATGAFDRFTRLGDDHLSRARTGDPDRRSPGVLIMKSLSERFSEGLSKQPKTVWMRYLLPVIGIVIALLVGGGISLILPKAYDFPSALLFLVAIFVVAWFGGHAPGAIACVLTMTLPLLGKSGSKLDFGRLGLLIAISLLIS